MTNLSFPPGISVRFLNREAFRLSSPGMAGERGDLVTMKGFQVRIVRIIKVGIDTIITRQFRLHGFSSPEQSGKLRVYRYPGTWEGTEEVFLHHILRVIA